MGRQRAGRRAKWAAIAVVVTVVGGCAPPDGGGGTPGRVTVQMNALISDGFFSLPWPNDIRKQPNGTLDLTGIPTGDNLLLSVLTSAAAAAVTDFGTISAVYFRTSGPIDEASLPSPTASAAADSPIQLVNLDDPDERIPLVLRREPADRYRPTDLISALPYPGASLRPATEYALVVTRGVFAADGSALEPAPLIAQLDEPSWFGRARSESEWLKLRAQRNRARAALEAATPWSANDLVGFTVYRTQDSQRDLRAITATLANRPITMPTLTLERPCDGSTRPAVFRGPLELPMFQFGSFPYRDSGGSIAIGADGRALVAGTRTVDIGIGVPCGTPPPTGWPIQSFIAGTGGGVDPDGSFTRAANSTVVGSIGPLYSFEGPGSTYDRTLFYNVLNPVAARSNPLQQAANNLVVLEVLRHFSVAGASVGTAGTVTTDDEIEVVTGHSQGAGTAALVAAMRPSVDAVVTSAAFAGSYNSIAYRSDIRTQFGQIIGDPAGINIRNPLVQVIQTLMDAAEPANYPTTGHWLNFAGKRDGCVPLEASRHLAAAQRLTVTNPQWGSIFGDAALDPPVAERPISGNVVGRTRVSVEADGVHQVAAGNQAMVGAFIDAVASGSTSVVVGPVSPGGADSCDPRYGDIGSDG